ncbi:LPXTG cell wall anchor domain-containing protein [Streptomyces alboniger]|uniref:LPXTG cell wall anchor domain-containing protein n=1 Tax=Streptomyces alboniger TaxID=132473 RepID=A0A5J6HN41_STRAD|nr:LPXTG cell wall anchor domain-containing protein [Streptomyces alboniger]QEV19851.1 LPXTG cell wall anchor domain-containing protein [Streptomyces alboniger]
MLTATAAGALLGALWFVPSANATSTGSHESARDDRPATSAAPHHETTASTGRLADTGGFDTTPYVIGGTAFLGLGAGFVAYSVRRERSAAARGAAY